MRTNRWRLRLMGIGLVMLLGLLTACSGNLRVIVTPPPGEHEVSGGVYLGNTNVPIASAIIRFHGIDSTRTVITNRQGRFFIHLEPGTYNVNIETIHGTYPRTLHVRKNATVEWNVLPTWFSSNLFYELSGLRQVYWDSTHGRTDWVNGELNRWEQKLVTVYFDYGNSVPNVPNSWENTYWAEIAAWQNLLDGELNFTKTYSRNQANIVISLVPNGSLGNKVSSRQLHYYESGALRLVTIEIDAGYWNDPGLWQHQMAHAMGMSYVDDQSSVMYPVHNPMFQRTALSTAEKNHARLIYDLPSGLKLAGGFQVLTLDVEADGEERAELFDAETGSSGYRGFVTTADGIVPLSEDEVRSLIDTY